MAELTTMPLKQQDVTHEPAGWKSYYYENGGHDYIPVHYDPDGGPEGRPAVWADDSMWTIDTPEQPNSILFLIYYRYWGYDGPLNLANATVSFRLRGDQLLLHGASCYFWVVSYTPKVTRWHYVHQPIPICSTGWGELMALTLPPDPALWHRSFSADRARPSGLSQSLATCFSYGFSFAGFSEKVTGRIGLGDFKIAALVDPAWPFTYNGKRDSSLSAWLTVSRSHRKQVCVDTLPCLSRNPQATAGDSMRPLCLEDDFLLFRFSEATPAIAYLTYVRAEQSTGGRDLRNAIVLVRHCLDHFDPRGGKIAFFIEHAASNTRWALWSPIEKTGEFSWYNILLAEERFWLRLSGEMPLLDILVGKEGRLGYDYLGLMVIGCGAEPTGRWELSQFSIGPAINE